LLLGPGIGDVTAPGNPIIWDVMPELSDVLYPLFSLEHRDTPVAIQVEKKSAAVLSSPV
jgi:hypothetical protein